MLIWESFLGNRKYLIKKLLVLLPRGLESPRGIHLHLTMQELSGKPYPLGIPSQKPKKRKTRNQLQLPRKRPVKSHGLQRSTMTLLPYRFRNGEGSRWPTNNSANSSR